MASNDQIFFKAKWDPEQFRFPGPNRVGMLGMHRKQAAYRVAHEKKGTTCPCCGRLARISKRRIYKRMAKVMLWLSREFERTGDWVVLKEGPLFRGGDNAKLALWHLVQTRPKREVEKNKRNSGEWMPTAFGLRFAKGEVKVPKFVYVYNNTILGYSESWVLLSDCLEGDFNLEDIYIDAE